MLEAKEKAGLEAVSRSRALLAKRGSMSRANLNMKRKKDREVAERLLATQLSRDLVSNPAKPEFESSASAQMVPDSTQPQSASESTAVASGTPQPARTVASQRRRDLARARAHGNAQMPKGEDAAINWGPALDGVTRPSTSDAGTNAENATSSSQEQASNGSDAGVYVPEGPPKEQTRNFSFSARAAAMNPSPAEASKDGTDGGWGTDSLRPSIKGDLGPGFVGGFGGSSAHSSRDPPPHYIRGADWGLGEDGGWGTGRGKARSRTQLFYGQQAEAERVVRERDTGRAELAASDEQQKAARLWSEDRIGKLGAEAVNVQSEYPCFRINAAQPTTKKSPTGRRSSHNHIAKLTLPSLSLCAFFFRMSPPPPPIDLSTGRSMLQGVEPLREMKVPPLAHGLDRVLFK